MFKLDRPDKGDEKQRRLTDRDSNARKLHESKTETNRKQQLSRNN